MRPREAANHGVVAKAASGSIERRRIVRELARWPAMAAQCRGGRKKLRLSRPEKTLSVLPTPCCASVLRREPSRTVPL